MTKYRVAASFTFLVLFLATILLLSTPEAFAREAGAFPVSSGSDRAVVDDGNVTHHSLADGGMPLGDEKDDCNWLCRLLRFLGTAAQIAIDVLVLVCKYNPKYCVF